MQLWASSHAPPAFDAAAALVRFKAAVDKHSIKMDTSEQRVVEESIQEPLPPGHLCRYLIKVYYTHFANMPM